VVDRVIDFHQGKLDFQGMQVLEYIRAESLQFYQMEKRDFENRKDRTYYFYRPPEESVE
tara:strand:- start:202 stop:378 length:177 start_codon:yes stop_codon:yes gene_type:complete